MSDRIIIQEGDLSNKVTVALKKSALVMFSSITKKIVVVDWFIAGVNRDSQRKQIASKLKRVAGKNLSHSKISLAKIISNLNLQAYKSRKKSIDTKYSQSFGLIARL